MKWLLEAARLLNVGLWICVWVLSLLFGVLALAEWVKPTPLGMLAAMPLIVFGGIVWLQVIFGGGLAIALEVDEWLTEEVRG